MLFRFCPCCDDTDILPLPETSRQLLSRMSDVDNSLITIYDRHRDEYTFRSPRFKELLDITAVKKNEKRDTIDFHTLIHPDDRKFVLDTETKTYRFWQKLPPEEQKNYKLVCDFRMKIPDGHYSRFIHQVVVLASDPEGEIRQLLVVSDLLAKKVSHCIPQRHLIHIKTEKLYLFNHESGEKLIRLLTQSEKRVLTHIAHGMNSQEIADHCCIGLCTVNGHRSNILRKIRAGNSYQAVMYAKCLGIIPLY